VTKSQTWKIKIARAGIAESMIAKHSATYVEKEPPAAYVFHDVDDGGYHGYGDRLPHGELLQSICEEKGPRL
jgi:hypothetical protein